MIYSLITLGLAPLLVAQGRRVRRDTPRLFEAAGERYGLIGKGAPLRLLIVGDSAAAGVGAAHQNEALAGQLVAALSERSSVTWRLIASTGHTIADVLNTLEQTSAENFDVVVTSIGVNDATAGTRLKIWSAQHAQLMRLLKEKFGARHIVVSAVPPMQHFPALPQPLRWYMGLRAQRLNQVLAIALKDSTQGELLRAEFPLEQSYMASDGFHPAPPAYAAWATQISRAIERRMLA